MSELDTTTFRRVLGHFPTGVTVVTATADESPVAFVVGSFFSVSLDPPLVGFCAIRTSRSWNRIRSANALCVNILADDQELVSRRLSSKRDDRFAGVLLDPGSEHAPRLTEALAWIDCEIDAIHPAGDHEICIARVHDLGVSREAGPLVYCRSAYGRFA